MKIKLVLNYTSIAKEKIKIKIKKHLSTIYTMSTIELEYLNYDIVDRNIKLIENKPNLKLINSLPKIS